MIDKSLRTSGFTLIELLVAITVFAIAGVAVMRSASEHIRAVTQLEESTVASYIAENQLQMAKVSRQWPPEKNSRGEVRMANRNWVWQLQSLETADPAFRQLKVSVSAAEEPQQVVYSLITFIGQPDA